MKTKDVSVFLAAVCTILGADFAAASNAVALDILGNIYFGRPGQ